MLLSAGKQYIPGKPRRCGAQTDAAPSSDSSSHVGSPASQEARFEQELNARVMHITCSQHIAEPLTRWNTHIQSGVCGPTR